MKEPRMPKPAAAAASPANATATVVKPWIIYTRVSTDEQAQHGVSLDVQRQACAGLVSGRAAAGAGVEVIEDGGYSGGTLQRPGMQQLLERVDAGTCAGVCIFAIDRLTRSLRDLLDLVERLERHGVSLIAVREQIDTSGVMGRFVLSLLGAVAQLEREMIGQRVRAAMAHRKGQGAFIGGSIPAGLHVVQDGELRRLAPHPETGPIIAEAWRLLAAGRTLTEAAAYVNGKGVRTSRGKPWSRTAMDALAKNEIYIGQLTDRATWEAARSAIARRSPLKGGRALDAAPVPSAKAHAPCLLAGFTFCGHCGAALIYGTGTGRTGTVYRYLRCSGRLKRGKTYCAAGDLPAETMEAAIIAALRRSLDDGTLLRSYAAELLQQQARASEAQGRLAALTIERDALQVRMQRVFALIEEGGLAAQAGRARVELLQDQLNRLTADMAHEEGTITAATMGEREQLLAENHLRSGIAALETASPADKATVLRGLVSRITATREQANLDLVGPGSHTRLEWRTRQGSNLRPAA
jgi:site-specific DNA recombinase